MARQSMNICRAALATAVLFASVLVCPVKAHEASYSTILDGLTEIPPNASPATGSAFITVDFDTLLMDVQISFAGLVGNTTASHIHCCTLTPGSANVGVATVLPTFTGFPLGVTSGTYDRVFDMALASSYNPAFVTAEGGISNAFSALVAGMETGNAYLNIHTTMFPGGEIRGLLEPAQPANGVPEPATLCLMGIGIAGLLLRRRLR